ncbi:MAG: nucleoside monophosphate kinase [Patescibacteria group bacterium]
MYKIALFGPQGSGKGTQAELLAEKYGLFHFSPGAQYRTEIKAGSAIGEIADQYINRGNLVPDEITNQLVADVLKRPEAQTGFILDGFPRNLVQADALDQMSELSHVLLIHIPEAESIERISNRRSCPVDGSTYHLTYKPPAQAAQCDQCGTALVQREDDYPESIKKRLSIYREQTYPVLERYKQRGIFFQVDGLPSIPEVFAQVQQILTGEKHQVA